MTEDGGFDGEDTRQGSHYIQCTWATRKKTTRVRKTATTTTMITEQMIGDKDH